VNRLTDHQRGSIELLFRETAQALNDAGFDQKAVLEKKSIPADNTQESIKEIWKAIQFAMFPPPEGKKVSTNQLTTAQVDQVYKVFHRFFADEPFYLNVNFPSNEPPMIDLENY